MATVTTTAAKGIVTQVLGNVVDIEFPPDKLPAIYNAIETEITAGGEKKTLILEVEQLLGNNVVRCVGMGPTDGMERGQAAYDTGGPITVPVGEGTLGRIFNVLGQPIDSDKPVEAAAHWPIHRLPPALKHQEPTARIFETGIKVVDLMAPYTRGGKVGL